MAELDGLRYTLHRCRFAPFDYGAPMHPRIIPKGSQTLYMAVRRVWTTKTRRLHLRTRGSVGSSRCHLQSCAAKLRLPQAIKNGVKHSCCPRLAVFWRIRRSTVMADRMETPCSELQMPHTAPLCAHSYRPAKGQTRPLSGNSGRKVKKYIVLLYRLQLYIQKELANSVRPPLIGPFYLIGYRVIDIRGRENTV